MVPHTPGVPPPPQVSPAGQAPQSRVPPQPSPTIPQYLPPGGVQVTAWHIPPPVPQTLATPPPPQVSVPERPPQSIRRPQPSPIMPQYLPPSCWQATGMQLVGSGAHTLAVTAPHVCPPGHAPQSRTRPQPSPTRPHSCPPGG